MTRRPWSADELALILATSRRDGELSEQLGRSRRAIRKRRYRERNPHAREAEHARRRQARRLASSFDLEDTDEL